uniref:U2 snRNP-associated SURP motif-containing protein n=1 Tax=Arcella intermedia TaxID=1963864 RepID=A0A6B2KZC9_9EUKA
MAFVQEKEKEIYKMEGKRPTEKENEKEKIKLFNIDDNKLENNKKTQPRQNPKKRRQIDLFAEELKRAQENRDRQKKGEKETVSTQKRFGGMRSDGFDREDDQKLSTNLYVGNLAPQVNEEILFGEFNKFGPIASLRILWPKGDEERHRPTNSGFVCFIHRKDAEKAMNELDAKPFFGKELRVNWGRAIQIAPTTKPMEAPTVRNIGVPPPEIPQISSSLFPTGPMNPIANTANPTNQNPQFTRAQIVVITPDDKTKRLIDYLAPFVLKDGARFERLLIDREGQNPSFGFLFNLGSSANIYYRWRVYSLLQGDTLQSWKTTPFQMFRNGPFWLPPPCNAEPTEEDNEPKISLTTKYRGKPLSEVERDIFEHSLRKLTPERESIKKAMIFCLDHSESAPEIVEILTEALTIPETHVLTKLARLYLVSDILHNAAGVSNGSLFRTPFEETLLGVFASFRDKHASIPGRITKQLLKEKVLKVFRVWSDWCLYPQDKLKLFYDTFMDLNKDTKVPYRRHRNPNHEFVDHKEGDEMDLDEPEEEPPSVLPPNQDPPKTMEEDDEDDDIDGAPLEEPPNAQVEDDDDDDDIDGVPLEEDLEAIAQE